MNSRELALMLTYEEPVRIKNNYDLIFDQFIKAYSSFDMVRFQFRDREEYLIFQRHKAIGNNQRQETSYRKQKIIEWDNQIKELEKEQEEKEKIPKNKFHEKLIQLARYCVDHKVFCEK